MPNSPQAKKRLRQSLERRDRNRARKSALRTQLKKVQAAVLANDVPLAEAEFRLACKKLDQNAVKRVIHRNAAARLKSRMSARIKAIKFPGGAPVAAPKAS